MCTFWRVIWFSVCSRVCFVCSGCGKLWGRWRRSTLLSKQRNMWSSCRSSGALNWLWTAVRQTLQHVSVCIHSQNSCCYHTLCAVTFCSPAHTCCFRAETWRENIIQTVNSFTFFHLSVSCANETAQTITCININNKMMIEKIH